jgi:cobaltochelatase CobN
MHLIAASPGAAADGPAPVDPGQTPGDVVVLSSADTEIALLAEARAAMPGAPVLRLLNLAHLAHPLSVDLHLDACATRSRLVVARILGGSGYWRHGIAQYAARLHAAGVPFVALPGDDRPDAELRALSPVNDADYAALWGFLTEGGPENAQGFLAHAQAMLDDTARPPRRDHCSRQGCSGPARARPTLTTSARTGRPARRSSRSSFTVRSCRARASTPSSA